MDSSVPIKTLPSSPSSPKPPTTLTSPSALQKKPPSSPKPPTDHRRRNINTIESAVNPWGANFEGGQDLLIDDAIGGGWFIFNGNTNGVAGDDEQVLLAQVTTNGMLSGSLYVQVFVNGNPNTDNRILLDLEDACVAPGGPEVCEFPEAGYDCEGNCLADADGDGVCDEFEVAGCTDATACNYDADATDDDGSVLATRRVRRVRR